MECTICLYDCGSSVPQINCTCPECVGYVCGNCMDQYIGMCFENNQQLKCVRPNCIGEYDLTSIEHLSEDTKGVATQVIYNSFKLRYIDKVNNHIKMDELVSAVRDKRLAFFNDLPKAVSKVASIAFAARMKKISKQKTSTMESKYTRVCFNLFCKGYLDQNMTCSKCGVVFCSECEDAKEDGHQCDAAKKKSVAFVNDLTPCPKCGTRIEKGEGCMAMTCAVCNTNFWYTTGETSHAGNHGQSIPVSLISSKKLVLEYKDVLTRPLVTAINTLESNYNMPLEITEKALISQVVYIARLSMAAGSENVHKDPAAIPYIAKFVSSYGKMIRTIQNKLIIGKKLSMILQILVKKEEGYLEKLNELCMTFVNVSAVSKGIASVVVATPLYTRKTIEEAMVLTKLRRKQIEHALNIKDGIVGDFLFEYVQ